MANQGVPTRITGGGVAGGTGKNKLGTPSKFCRKKHLKRRNNKALKRSGESNKPAPHKAKQATTTTKTRCKTTPIHIEREAGRDKQIVWTRQITKQIV